MADFSSATFPSLQYDSFRPRYSNILYEKIFDYHGPRDRTLAIDVGCGTGQVTLALADHFGSVIGVDPSATMLSSATRRDNVVYEVASAHDMDRVTDEATADMITAGEAAHWFGPEFFVAAHRALKPGGTLAIWAYSGARLASHEEASNIVNTYAHHKDYLADLWIQPGTRLLQNLYRDIVLPTNLFVEERRLYSNSADVNKKEEHGELVHRSSCSLKQFEMFFRTLSAVHAWKTKHPAKKSLTEGGTGDIVDEMMARVYESNGGTLSQESTVDILWPSVLILARKK